MSGKALHRRVPCYIFTVAWTPSFKKIAKKNSIKVFVDGITTVVIGALVGAVIFICSNRSNEKLLNCVLFWYLNAASDDIYHRMG